MSIVTDGLSLTAEVTLPGNSDDITPYQINRAMVEVFRKAASRVANLDPNRYCVGDVRFDFDLAVSNDMSVHVELLDLQEDIPINVKDVSEV